MFLATRFSQLNQRAHSEAGGCCRWPPTASSGPNALATRALRPTCTSATVVHQRPKVNAVGLSCPSLRQKRNEKCNFNISIPEPTATISITMMTDMLCGLLGWLLQQARSKELLLNSQDEMMTIIHDSLQLGFSVLMRLFYEDGKLSTLYITRSSSTRSEGGFSGFNFSLLAVPGITRGF